MEPALQALIASLIGFLFVSLIFAVLVLLCRDASKSRLSDSQIASDVEGASALRSLDRTRSLPLRYAAEESSASYDPSLDYISMSELVAATRNFAADGIIGDGSFGFVYKARLSSGATVAVKRLSKDAAHGVREFKAEMDTLGRIRHPNLVRMLGFCVAGHDRVLVYEYVKHGSLDQWLHEDDDEGRPRSLPWRTRLGIVRGVAAGLTFLHDGCQPAVIHRDIKASNVLLDEGFEARITDFGLARLMEAPRTHVSTQVAGTMGYMAPEYWEGATTATVKGDVYSFGILMLEVATRRRPNLGVRQEGGGGRKEMLLANWARAMVEQGRIPEILDSEMGSEDVVESEVRAYLKVAFRCTEESSRNRPTMEDVLADLNQF
ncbi:leucine-rich repeat receptor protein kinase MSP1-like [Curcuma longa]|uniref:leucine-rich repeat receptor protein kinase MSP1-like n=1 Tax=Curcuma longa TaxID=136217 RepID=UPI003D9ECDAE